MVGQPEGGEGVMLVDGVVTHSDAGYKLVLSTRYAGQHDRRAIEASSCGALGESTALVVAVALNPAFDPSAEPPRDAPAGSIIPTPAVSKHAGDATRAADPTAQRVVDREQPVPAPTPAREATPSPSGEDARPTVSPAWTAWVAPGIEYGAVPGVGGSTELGVGVLWRHAGIELAGTHVWPRRGHSGLYQQGTVAAYGCARLWAGAVELPACLGVHGGTLRIDSRGLRQRSVAHGPWIAPSARIGARVATERLWLRLAGDVSIAAMRARVVVGDDAVFRARPVSLTLSFGAGFFFTIDPARSEHR